MSRSAAILRKLRRQVATAFLSAAAVFLLVAVPFLVPSVSAAAEPPAVKVKVSDLDLNSAQGQEVLAQRLRTAIDKVCDEAGSTSSPITAPMQVKRCKQQATENVQQQLEQRQLSRVLVARH